MSARLKRNYDWLKVLKKAKPKERKELFKIVNQDLVTCIGECALNVCNGCVKLSAKQKKALKKHQKSLRILGDKKTSVKKKREVLVQSGGFVPALLGPVLAIAGTILAEIIAKK